MMSKKGTLLHLVRIETQEIFYTGNTYDQAINI